MQNRNMGEKVKYNRQYESDSNISLHQLTILRNGRVVGPCRWCKGWTQNAHLQVSPRATISKVHVVGRGYGRWGVIGRGTEAPEGEGLFPINNLHTRLCLTPHILSRILAFMSVGVLLTIMSWWLCFSDILWKKKGENHKFPFYKHNNRELCTNARHARCPYFSI